MKQDAKQKQDGQKKDGQKKDVQKKDDQKKDVQKKDDKDKKQKQDDQNEQDIVVNELQPNEKEQEHVVEKNETLATICAKYGILHPEVVYDYEPNRSIFYESLEDQGVKKDGQNGKDEKQQDKKQQDEKQQAKKRFSAVLKEGTKLKIPPLKVSHAGKTGMRHVFRLKPVKRLPPSELELARLLAMDLTLEAYRELCRERSSSTSWEGFKLRNLRAMSTVSIKSVRKRPKEVTKTRLGVTAAKYTAIAGGALAYSSTLPVSVPLTVALLPVRYTCSKILQVWRKRELSAELREFAKSRRFQHADGSPFDGTSHLTWLDALHPSDRGNLRKQHYEELKWRSNPRFWKGKKHTHRGGIFTSASDARKNRLTDIEQARVLDYQAKTSLRKAVVHMRKARWLLDDGNERIQSLLAHSGGYSRTKDSESWGSCAELIADAKYGMKFLHEVDTFKNYLLPVLTFLVFFLDEYELYLQKWEEARAHFEAPILAFMRSYDHEPCKTVFHSEEGTWKSLKEFWKNRGRYCIHDASDEKARKERWQRYGSGAVSFNDLPPDAKDAQKKQQVRDELQLKTHVIELRKVRGMVASALIQLQRSMVLDEYWSKAYSDIDHLLGYSSAERRYELFKRDLRGRYDEPSLWRKTRHNFANYNLKKSASEKGTEFLTELMELGQLVTQGSEAFAIQAVETRMVELSRLASNKKTLPKGWREQLKDFWPAELKDDVAKQVEKGTFHTSLQGKYGMRSRKAHFESTLGRYADSPVGTILGIAKHPLVERALEEVERQSKLVVSSTAGQCWSDWQHKKLNLAQRTYLLPDAAERLRLDGGGDLEGKTAKTAAITLDSVFDDVLFDWSCADKVWKLLHQVFSAGNVPAPITCAGMKAYARDYLAFHYHLDRCEAGLRKIMTVVLDLVRHAYDLNHWEQAVMSAFDHTPTKDEAEKAQIAGHEVARPGKVKRWLRDARHHERCEKVCYGRDPEGPSDRPRLRLRKGVHGRGSKDDVLKVSFAQTAQTSAIVNADHEVRVMVESKAKRDIRFQIASELLDAPVEGVIKEGHTSVKVALTFKRAGKTLLSLYGIEGCSPGPVDQSALRFLRPEERQEYLLGIRALIGRPLEEAKRFREKYDDLIEERRELLVSQKLLENGVVKGHELALEVYPSPLLTAPLPGPELVLEPGETFRLDPVVDKRGLNLKAVYVHRFFEAGKDVPLSENTHEL